MSRKIKIPRTRLSEEIYKKRYGRNNLDSFSIYLYVETEWGEVSMVQMVSNDCSDFCMEYYGDYDIERFVTITDPSAIKKICDKFSTRDAQTLIKRIVKNFKSFEHDALRVFENFLEKKDIKYTVSLY